MKAKNYKNLLAYQKSYEVALQVYKVTSAFPSSEIYGLVSQMRRAAISVPSNLETQLSLSRDLNYIDESNFKKVYEMNEEVGRLLSSYIKGINV